MMITIGIGIITFTIGMFVGSMIKKQPREDGHKNLFRTVVDNIKAKIAQNKLEKAARTKMMNEARLAALQNLQPEMIEMMKQEELKKLTGEGKKNKLQKFADAMSTKGTGLGSTEKLNRMLGIQQPQAQHQQQQQYQQPIQQPQQPFYQQQQYQQPIQQPQQQQTNSRNKKKKKGQHNTQQPLKKQTPVFNINDKLNKMLRS